LKLLETKDTKTQARLTINIKITELPDEMYEPKVRIWELYKATLSNRRSEKKTNLGKCLE